MNALAGVLTIWGAGLEDERITGERKTKYHYHIISKDILGIYHVKPYTTGAPNTLLTYQSCPRIYTKRGDIEQ